MSLAESISFPGAFEYRGDTLHCEGVSLAAIADIVVRADPETGTPVLVLLLGTVTLGPDLRR